MRVVRTRSKTPSAVMGSGASLGRFSSRRAFRPWRLRTLGLFLDGDLIGASPEANVVPATEPLTLGPAQAGGGAVLFDEVALYDRAFLGTEVADHLAVVEDVAVRSGAPAPK